MKFLKRIFKRFRKPKYAPGGYVTPPAAWGKHPRSGEMIISREQSVFASSLINALHEIENEEIEVSEADVANIVKRAGKIAMVAETINSKINAPQQEYKTNCPNCGAPLKDGKCEYCGTTYNN